MSQNILADKVFNGFVETSSKVFQLEMENEMLRQENARLMQVLADLEAKLKENETPAGENDG